MEKRIQTVMVSAAGRIVIPAAFRKELGIKAGDVLVVQVDDDELRLFTPRSGIARAQALVRKYIPPGISLVDELIAERRAEAAREDEEFERWKSGQNEVQ